MQPTLRDGVATAHHLGEQFHVGLFAERGFDAIEQQGMIVHGHHRDDVRGIGVGGQVGSSMFASPWPLRQFQRVPAAFR